jgi:hypothetical protein
MSRYHKLDQERIPFEVHQRQWDVREAKSRMGNESSGALIWGTESSGHC